MPGYDIITIGASAGGVEALKELVRGLPGNLPASIFMVLHVTATAPDVLPDILNHSGSLLAVSAKDGDVIQHGYIYSTA